MKDNPILGKFTGPAAAGRRMRFTKAESQHVAEELKTAYQRIEELETALKLFLAEDETMENILWGNEPDSALVKFTIVLGKYREARKVLRAPDPSPAESGA